MKNKHIKYEIEDRELALKASAIFRSQSHRCYSAKSHAYKQYGAKGINVEYSRQDFVNWYVSTAKNANTSPKNLVVGRIDHEKGYSFDNIRLETKSFSSNEMLDRTKWRKKILICDDITGQELVIAISQKEASALTGVGFKTINSQLRVPSKFYKSRTKHGFRFYYLKE